MPQQSDSLSALPSTVARALAFISILIGGLAGALIGYALVDVQTDNASGFLLGIGLLLGAILSAAGTAVVAVLVLRALGEWREMADK